MIPVPTKYVYKHHLADDRYSGEGWGRDRGVPVPNDSTGGGSREGV